MTSPVYMEVANLLERWIVSGLNMLFEPCAVPTLGELWNLILVVR
jgi:hypothetical protein